MTIGTGTTTNQSLPIEPYYGYSYSQAIYLASEINSSGFISKLAYNFAGSNLSNSNTWKIYLGHTSKTQFNSSTDWVPLSELTLVYDATFASPGSSGWIEFDLSNFNYNGTDNLVIAVEDDKNLYNGDSDDFYCTAASSRSIEYHNDGTNPDPSIPPSGNVRNYIANVILNIAQAAPNCTSSRVPVTAFVQNFPAHDAGVMKINSPISGPGKNNAETLNVTVKNYGTVTLNAIPVAYVLDGAAAIVDTVFQTLNPGDTANFSFATTMNMSNIATYNVMAYTELSGDVVNNNDTAMEAIIHSDYCISMASNTSDGDIGNVTIKHPFTGNDLLNHGVAIPVTNNFIANKTYSDFTGLTPTILQAGQDYVMNVSQITSGANFWGSTTKVYIDLNQDGLLDAATELVYSGNITNNASQNMLTSTLSIPANATLGNTRMRVVLDESTNADPCGTYGWVKPKIIRCKS